MNSTVITQKTFFCYSVLFQRLPINTNIKITLDIVNQCLQCTLLNYFWERGFINIPSAFSIPDRSQHHQGWCCYAVSDAILPSCHPCSHFFSEIRKRTLVNVLFTKRKLDTVASVSERATERWKYIRTWMTKISSLIRCPTSPSPPRPTVDIIIRKISRYWGWLVKAFCNKSVSLSCALLISL